MTELAASQIDEEGFVVVPEALGPVEIDAIGAAVAELGGRISASGRGGARRLFQEALEIRLLAGDPAVRSVAVAALGAACFPVRALLFDKTPAANWKVTWHQDLTIAVRARRDVEGYGPWSSKAGIPHVQPPISVLELGGWARSYETITAPRVFASQEPGASTRGPHRVRGGRVSGRVEVVRSSSSSLHRFVIAFSCRVIPRLYHQYPRCTLCDSEG